MDPNVRPEAPAARASMSVTPGALLLPNPPEARQHSHPRRTRIVLDRHIARIDSDFELDPPVVWRIRVAALHPALDIEGRSEHPRGELDQDSVTRGFRDPAAIERNGRVDQLAAKLSVALRRALLVGPGRPAVARHTSGQDGGQLAGRVHGPSHGASWRPGSRTLPGQNCL
jgi:hypothetical protein